MIRNPDRNDAALTGLEIILILIVLIAVTALLLVYIGRGGLPDWARTFPGGLVAESMYISGDNIQLAGSVYGFDAVSGTKGNTMVFVPHQDPGSLGVIRARVALFMGDTGAIDMNRLTVTWNNGTSTERIVRTSARTLLCPNWTISGKYNMLPGRTVDSDDWLEPQEQFELTICPSEAVYPYGSLVITLSPDGVAMPLTISRVTPPRIQPVMNLG